MMTRRLVLTVTILLGALGAPSIADAQGPGKIVRIGRLGLAIPPSVIGRADQLLE